jgi:hypothetical protein
MTGKTTMKDIVKPARKYLFMLLGFGNNVLRILTEIISTGDNCH